ncbi:MAG: hypothetical protein L6R48_09665 [Planctomycetes bacterium]|nr:hypothetical protein [Planctomycetota bacterium]
MHATADALRQYLELKLMANGLTPVTNIGVLEVARDLMESYQEKNRVLSGYLCPADRRIQQFLDRHFADVAPATGALQLPNQSFMLDKPGLARLLSLPADGDQFHTPLLSSYRVRQGVLHNPRSDRRTTAGSFHVCAGGLAVAGDKREVPKAAWARLFQAAFQPPHDDLLLPWTARSDHRAHLRVSLLIRPLVCPAVPAADPRLALPERRMEIRFFAPGTLVANLDFVESIFGNAGNPYLPEVDAALDADGWSGHTGCVILAPHLTGLSKKALGLPHASAASARERRDRMCWEREDELYNDGQAFKATCRTAEGVIITLIADNYFGYCKKEVKTQIGFAANLMGLAEEEHAGGALAFPSYVLGEEWEAKPQPGGATMAEVRRACGELFEAQPQGHGVDRRFPSIVYVPEDSHFNARELKVRWGRGSLAVAIPLRANHTYVLPSGYKVRLVKHPGASSWRLEGTVAEGTFCHKPCTVSGGGKSEISKSIRDSFIYGPLFVSDLDHDLGQVAALLARDYADRLRPEVRPDYTAKPSRPILDPERSLGSVIKLFTPSPAEFTAEYNAWLAGIPTRILTLLFVVKRFHKPEWGADWRSHFSVDTVNGAPGHQLKVDGRAITASYLRVGIGGDGAWRTYKLRQDFVPADKVQLEDDITASVTVPAAWLAQLPGSAAGHGSVKLAENCETRLFQRPDDAIHRGHDKQAEADLAGVNGPVFLSNFEPLDAERVRLLLDDPIGLDRWTAPMRRLVEGAARDGQPFTVSSAHPRLVDGKPSKNPRYLQERPDLVDARGTHLAHISTRLARRMPAGAPLVVPVAAVLGGRRNNPAEKGVRALCAHGPMHWLELPELVMEWASSLTGKSPSTTGAGSEGALTKGPFNALLAFPDLDNAWIAMALGGYDGWMTSAAWIGPRIQVGHDISLLVPELWCRLAPEERDARRLLAAGQLERLDDFQHEGRTVLASRLGCRITEKFVHSFFGRLLDNPAAVFDQAMLRPETQDRAAWIDSIDNVVEAQAACARQYLDDGAARLASPPLVALLDIMATGGHGGLDARSPALRAQFTREAVLAAPWYRARLESLRERELALVERKCAAIEEFLARASHAQVAARLGLRERLEGLRRRREAVAAPAWLDAMAGTLGRAPLG